MAVEVAGHPRNGFLTYPWRMGDQSGLRSIDLSSWDSNMHLSSHRKIIQIWTHSTHWQQGNGHCRNVYSADAYFISQPRTWYGNVDMLLAALVVQSMFCTRITPSGIPSSCCPMKTLLYFMWSSPGWSWSGHILMLISVTRQTYSQLLLGLLLRSPKRALGHTVLDYGRSAYQWCSVGTRGRWSQKRRRILDLQNMLLRHGHGDLFKVPSASMRWTTSTQTLRASELSLNFSPLHAR